VSVFRFPSNTKEYKKWEDCIYQILIHPKRNDLCDCHCKQKNLVNRTVPFENELVSLNGRIGTVFIRDECVNSTGMKWSTLMAKCKKKHLLWGCIYLMIVCYHVLWHNSLLLVQDLRCLWLTTEHTTEILEIWPCLLLLGGVQIIDSSFTRNSSLVVCGSHGPIPWPSQTVMVMWYTTTATAMKTWITNCELSRNCQISSLMLAWCKEGTVSQVMSYWSVV